MRNKSLLERIRKVEQGTYEEPQVVRQPIDFKKLVKPVISIVLGVGAAVIGLIFLLQPAIDKAISNPDIGDATKGLLSALPIVFVVFVLVGAVAYFSTVKDKEEVVEDKEEEENKVLNA